MGKYSAMKCILYKKYVKTDTKRTEKVIELNYWFRRDVKLNITLQINLEV